MGIYEIDGLYPGYGHTLGNSLRRIILSSIQGVAITSIKIDGVPHEFSTIPGMREDVISLILNLKKVRFSLQGVDRERVSLSAKGPKTVLAGDLKTPSQVEVLNQDQYLCELSDKHTELSLELTIERGIGYVGREIMEKSRVEIGAISLDAAFTPIRRVSYEVENMRVGDRTDFNRLRLAIETDGSVSPRESLEKSIEVMIEQLRAIVGFKMEESLKMNEPLEKDSSLEGSDEDFEKKTEAMDDPMKIKLEETDMSTRTLNALLSGGVKTLGGLSRKKKSDLFEMDGFGEKGMQEVKRLLSNYGITLKD